VWATVVITAKKVIDRATRERKPIEQISLAAIARAAGCRTWLPVSVNKKYSAGTARHLNLTRKKGNLTVPMR